MGPQKAVVSNPVHLPAAVLDDRHDGMDTPAPDPHHTPHSSKAQALGAVFGRPGLASILKGRGGEGGRRAVAGSRGRGCVCGGLGMWVWMMMQSNDDVCGVSTPIHTHLLSIPQRTHTPLTGARAVGRHHRTMMQEQQQRQRQRMAAAGARRLLVLLLLGTVLLACLPTGA